MKVRTLIPKRLDPMDDPAHATVIANLVSAGFRLVGPDELDPATVERCAQVVAARGPATQDMTSTMICDALDEAAAALRTLTGGNNGR